MAQSIFKNLAMAARVYLTEQDNNDRTSQISTCLKKDKVEKVTGLSLKKIKQLCSDSVFRSAKKFEVKNSSIISTQISYMYSKIEGEYRSAFLYNQLIVWEGDEKGAEFNLNSILVYCDCKYFDKETRKTGYCCSHIIGQLRRTYNFSKTW